MPSESAAAGDLPLPPDLRADHRDLERVLSPWLARHPARPDALPLLTRFGLMVHDQASRLSIIAKGDRSALFTRHVLDSLNPVSLFERPPESALDVGSGAGFPGIPLAIVWPETRFILLESRAKKVGFLERVVRELALGNAAVVCARLEEIRGEVPLQRAAFVRAIGDLPELLPRIEHRCAPGARWVYFLGTGTPGDRLASEIRSRGRSASIAAGAFGGRLLHGAFGG